MRYKHRRHTCAHIGAVILSCHPRYPQKPEYHNAHKHYVGKAAEKAEFFCKDSENEIGVAERNTGILRTSAPSGAQKTSGGNGGAAPESLKAYILRVALRPEAVNNSVLLLCAQHFPQKGRGKHRNGGNRNKIPYGQPAHQQHNGNDEKVHQSRTQISRQQNKPADDPCVNGKRQYIFNFVYFALNPLYMVRKSDNKQKLAVFRGLNVERNTRYTQPVFVSLIALAEKHHGYHQHHRQSVKPLAVLADDLVVVQKGDNKHGANAENGGKSLHGHIPRAQLICGAGKGNERQSGHTQSAEEDDKIQPAEFFLKAYGKLFQAFCPPLKRDLQKGSRRPKV